MKNTNGVDIKIIQTQSQCNKIINKQCHHNSNKLKNKIVAMLLIMCLTLADFAQLLGSSVSIALPDQTEQEIEISQEITKYIPYSYSENDEGIILQQKVNLILPQVENIITKDFTVTIPMYSDILPDNIVLRTESKILTQDNTQNSYYQINSDIQQIAITQEVADSEAIYITYYYPAEAYDKYLETTHVNEYPDGKIVSIEKDEETGEVWAYIDFAWDPEENEGEMPSNKHLVDQLPIVLKTNAQITTDQETISKDDQKDINLDISINGIINNTISTNISEISKGNLYNSKEVNYEVKNTLNIIRSDILNIVTIEDLGTHFISENETINLANIENNYIYISKTNLEEILGAEGYIKLLDENLQEIATINSSTNTDKNNNYVFTYPEGTKKVNLEISNIENDGFLVINQNKTISSSQEYSKTQLTEFNSLRTASYMETTDINNNTHNEEQTVEILLTETYTNADLKINNTNLSTIDENTGIEFTIELKNNNIHSDLWANPFIIIEMPPEIQDITINGDNLLYGGGITLHSSSIIELNGNKAIKIQLVGEQIDFISDSIIGGTTIVINTNITLKELTATSQNNTINMYYFNSNKTNYTNSTTIELEETYEVGLTKSEFNYIAPIEFKTIHKISEFDEKGSIISSENSEKEVGKISILEPEKQVKQTIILMNNTGNETTQIKALGRIPFVGNTDIISNEDLGTTLNIEFANLIQTLQTTEKEIAIYYSENEKADTNLENVENKWTQEPENIQNIKTYMIVINNMAQGEKLQFTYNLKIPEMLEHGEYLYSSLATYYTNNTEVGAVEETSKASTVGLTTGIGARAKIELSAGINTTENFTEGQKIKYTLKVSNTGELPAENVIVSNPIPNGTSYIEETVVKNDIETFNKYTYYSSSNELQWELGKVEPNQQAELEYTVVVNNVPSILEYYGMYEGFTEEDGKYYIIQEITETGEQIRTEITQLPEIIVTNKAILKSDNIEKEIYSNELQNKVLTSYFDILEEVSVEKAVYIQESEIYSYTLIIENKTDLQMQNLEVSKIIPDGVTYKKAEIMQGEGQVNYTEETKELKITSNTFNSYEIIEIVIEVEANKLPEGVYKKDITTNSTVKAEGIEANTSSSVTNTIAKPKITAKIECDVKQRYVYEKDILNYTITITNESDMTAANLILTNIIPDGTTFVSGSYTRGGNEYTLLTDGTNEITLETNLNQETIVVNIKVQVNRIETNVEELEIINKATINANNVEEYTIGQIKHTVIKTSGSGSGDNTEDNTGNNQGGQNQGGQSQGGNNQSGNNQGGQNQGESIGGETGTDGKVRYKIKGSVWNDVNKDGERQDEEDTITGVKVYLMNKNGEIIKDYETGEEKISTTDIDGEYEFRNVESGEYIVIFMYDNNLYNITEYQKLGVVNDRNSDAILKTIYFGGTEQQAGVTDIIEITNRSIYGIDLGLSTKDKFNLELEAGISNITIKTKKETKQIPYNMANLAKVEISASQINGATVIVEYELKITNNSDIPGSATQIMANKANGLIFSSSENNDWYEGNDKNLYLSGLTNKIINPGESVNTKLILVKQITGSNIGTVENTFTITKTYNEKGLEETNLEDNYKKVTCIIATSTGTAVAYTGISILILSIFSIGIYVIRKKLGTEKRWI